MYMQVVPGVAPPRNHSLKGMYVAPHGGGGRNGPGKGAPTFPGTYTGTF